MKIDHLQQLTCDCPSSLYSSSSFTHCPQIREYQTVAIVDRTIASSSVLFLGGVGEVTGPKREVVSQQLHDRGWIAVLVLFKTVEVCNGVIEGSLRELAGVVRRVQDLIVEDWVVEGKAEADRVCGLELLWFVWSNLVGLLGVLNDLLSAVSCQEFSEISKIVAFHFQEENFGLGILGVGNEWVVEESQHVIADVFKLLLDLCAVSLDDVNEARALWDFATKFD